MANYILRREPEGNQIRLGLKVGGFCKKNITMGGGCSYIKSCRDVVFREMAVWWRL